MQFLIVVDMNCLLQKTNPGIGDMFLSGFSGIAWLNTTVCCILKQDVPQRKASGSNLAGVCACLCPPSSFLVCHGRFWRCNPPHHVTMPSGRLGCGDKMEASAHQPGNCRYCPGEWELQRICSTAEALPCPRHVCHERWPLSSCADEYCILVYSWLSDAVNLLTWLPDKQNWAAFLHPSA